MNLEYIKWYDSLGCSSRWTEVNYGSLEPMICESVGWIIWEDESAILIAPHKSNTVPKQVCGDMLISKQSIIDRLACNLVNIS